MLLGSTGSGLKFRSFSSFVPWNSPQSTSSFLPAASTRYFDPVTLPAAPRNVSFAIALPFYRFPVVQALLPVRSSPITRLRHSSFTLLALSLNLSLKGSLEGSRERGVSKGAASCSWDRRTLCGGFSLPSPFLLSAFCFPPSAFSRPLPGLKTSILPPQNSRPHPIASLCAAPILPTWTRRATNNPMARAVAPPPTPPKRQGRPSRIVETICRRPG